MPDSCTCGAQLPPDALFCHKCGKPQRDLVVPETIAPPPPPTPEEAAVPVSRVQAVPLNFHNPVAIRISLSVAIVATMLFFLPYLNWMGAGFFAVFLYRRRTGALLNMESGVRMGWMTGILMFGMMAVLLTISMVIFQAAGGIAVVQSELKNAMDPRMVEALNLLQSGPAVARLLIQLFVFMTLLSMAGGALGAKMGGRSQG
jgi:zinc-ribbon domain